MEPIKLHQVVRKYRAAEYDWRASHPPPHHIYEWYDQLASLISAELKDATEILVPDWLYSGGLPKYNFIMTQLLEDGKIIKPLTKEVTDV